MSPAITFDACDVQWVEETASRLPDHSNGVYPCSKLVFKSGCETRVFGNVAEKIFALKQQYTASLSKLGWPGEELPDGS